jgi:membrane peptidoglycan carboxypeptidase
LELASIPVKVPRSRGSRIVRRIAYGILGFLGLGVIAFAIAYVLTPIPDSTQAAAQQRLNTYYYADGKTVITQEGTNRVPVDIKVVPKSMQDAVISAENRSFRTDPGVSLRGTARAFWSTVSGGQVQGGSTITQQMVRNYYNGIDRERSVFRKFKEVMVSLKVSQSQPKSWIMEQYLNTIYFGRQAYGVQAAAQAYYRKDVKDLTPAESAYLAAAIQQPTLYENVTKKNQAGIEQRWHYVIDGMVEGKSLSAQDAAKLKFPKPKAKVLESTYGGDKGYMVVSAKNELKRKGYTDQEIALGGLSITTTFKKPLMDAAKETIQQLRPKGMDPDERIGMVTVDPANGEVVSFYGGDNYLKSEFSSSFYSTAQIGSGFKPFVLAAALASGMKLDDTVSGNEPYSCTEGKSASTDEISNDSGEGSLGDINLVRATSKSSNTAFARLGQEVGLDKVRAMAEKFGLPKDRLEPKLADGKAALNVNACSYPLGIVSMSPLNQASAYATFASGGMYYKPHFVKSVIDGSNKKHDYKEKGTRAVSAQVAGDATYAMQKVVETGTATRAQLDDREAAGKTGTTENGAAVWFNGFVPQLSTSVAVFHFKAKNHSKELVIPGYDAYGGSFPATVWQSFMTKATSGMEVKEFPEPSTYASNSGYDHSAPQVTDEATDQPTDEPTDKPTGTPTPDPTQNTPSPDPTQNTPKPDPTTKPTDNAENSPKPQNTNHGGV